MFIPKAALVGLVVLVSLAACGGPSPSPSPSSSSPSAHGSGRGEAPPVPASPTDLAGRWEVVRVDSILAGGPGGATVPRDAGIVFAGVRSVSGSDSINSFSGEYRFFHGEIRLEGVTTTLVGLGPGAPAMRRHLQAAFAAVLGGGAVHAWLSGGKLRLEAGTWMLTLVRPLEG